MGAAAVLATTLEALLAELRRDGTADSLCSRTVYSGAGVPLDYAECGGMAWARLVTAFPTARFPQPDTSVDNCAATLALTVEVGVGRGAPLGETGFNKQYTPPTEAEEFAAAEAQMRDMEAMHRALVVVRRTYDLMVLGSYTPFGPEGGSVGGSWTFTVTEED